MATLKRLGDLLMLKMLLQLSIRKERGKMDIKRDGDRNKKVCGAYKRRKEGEH